MKVLQSNCWNLLKNVALKMLKFYQRCYLFFNKIVDEGMVQSTLDPVVIQKRVIFCENKNMKCLNVFCQKPHYAIHFTSNKWSLWEVFP